MCGIFGIYNHRDAANLTYLGLHALQHRGQESAGISITDREIMRTSQGWDWSRLDAACRGRAGRPP